MTILLLVVMIDVIDVGAHTFTSRLGEVTCNDIRRLKKSLND